MYETSWRHWTCPFQTHFENLSPALQGFQTFGWIVNFSAATIKHATYFLFNFSVATIKHSTFFGSTLQDSGQDSEFLVSNVSEFDVAM